MTDITFEDQVKKLEDSLAKFKDLIVVDEEKNKGENFHYFGPYNTHLEQNDVNDVVTILKAKYEKFKSINSPATVMKLVNEKKGLSSVLKPIQSCLKKVNARLREVTKDSTLKSTMQRLEAISIETGLKFDCEQMSNNCFISSDMFYVEVVLNQLGLADDVKIHGHTGEPQSCKELITALRTRNYKEFSEHLIGLRDRYLLQGNTFMKSKILSSLEALEEDLVKIQNSDVSYNLISESISRGPVGHITPRVGGKCLKLTYCVEQLSLLDTKNKGIIKVYSTDDPLPSELGYSVDVAVQQSSTILLPFTSITVLENNSLKYIPQDSSNSQVLPATFVLKFKKPLPISIHLAKWLYRTLKKGDKFVHSSSVSVDDLIIQQCLKKSLKEIEEDEFVSEKDTSQDVDVKNQVLPDQTHLYRCIGSSIRINPGILLSNIPFTHPSQVPQIIKKILIILVTFSRKKDTLQDVDVKNQLLRYQATYNILLCSCLKMDKVEDNENEKFVFDVCAGDWNVINVTFIHPIDNSIGSVDFTITADGTIQTSLNFAPGAPVFSTNEYMTKVVNRCTSIPISMRCFFKKSTTYKPELQETKSNTLMTKTSSSSGGSTVKHKQHPKMKLHIPSLAQIQSGLMSPQLMSSSPSSFLNLSATGSITPTVSTTNNKASRKRTSSMTISTPNTPATPGSSSDGGSTPSKLKLKLKKKKNNVYEIDQQPPSEFIIPESTISSSHLVDIKPNRQTLDFLPDFDTGASSLRNAASSMYPTSSTLTTFPIDADTDISGILGIGDAFNASGTPTFSTASQVPAFDLDAITSGSDLNLDSVSASAIDPSALKQESFDMEASGMLDIDSIMNAGP